MIKILITFLIASVLAQNQPPVVHQIEQDPNLSKFNYLINEAISVFNNVTVFASTNDYLTNITINNLRANPPLLFSTLLYQVSYVSEGNLGKEQLLPSLAGPLIRINTYNNNVTTANCVKVYGKVQVEDSYLYDLDGVLRAPRYNIDEAVKLSSNLTTLAILMNSSYVILNEAMSYTFFAPSNSAFAKLPANVLNTLATNISLLRQVLLYHVVPVNTVCSLGVNNETLTTFSGSQLHFVKANNGYVTVNGVNVIEADLVQTNGVIHIIDQVLIPPYLTELTSISETSSQMAKEGSINTENSSADKITIDFIVMIFIFSIILL